MAYKLKEEVLEPTPKSRYDDSYFAGLKPARDDIFPKKCAKCGTVYINFEDFLQKTDDLPESSGLQYFGEGQSITALFRNCTCRSTLIVSCESRRDESIQGIKHREIFEKILEMLKKVNPDAASCRNALLKLIR